MPITPQLQALAGFSPLGFPMPSPLRSISILLPRDYGRPRFLRAIHAVATACPGAQLTVRQGDTDAPCVDTVPMGGESVIARVIASATGGVA